MLSSSCGKAMKLILHLFYFFLLSIYSYGSQGYTDNYVIYMDSCSIDISGYENMNNGVLLRIRKSKISKINLNFNKPSEKYIQKTINKKIWITTGLYIQIFKNVFSGEAIYLLFYEQLEKGIAFSHFSKEEIYDELKCLGQNGVSLEDLSLNDKEQLGSE